MVFYILPSGFSLKGSLDKEKNINALWITLYLWEDCFEEDYESEEEYEEARGEFDKIFEKVFKVLEKKLGKPAVKGISKDEDAFHYACWEYKKDCVLCLEQNDRDIEEGMEVSITLTPLKKKAKPVFIYL